MVYSHINKLSMYLIVITVLDKFDAIIAGIPAFLKVVTSFKGLIANISTLSEETGVGTTGKTRVKQTAASVMAETVATLVGVLHAYACDLSDEDLMEQSDISETDIIHTRDAQRGSYATLLVDLVEKNKAALVDWGASDADIEEARRTITEYNSSLSNRDFAKAEQEGARESIESMFARADRMLYRQLDKLVKSQKAASPEFCAEYQAARVIRDMAATRKGENQIAEPATK